MHRPALSLLLLVALIGAAACARPASAAARHDLTYRQARQIALLVAHHENIDLADTHVQMTSMDLSSDFVPGFYSFIIIRESTTPGPDETLRRYAINRRTGSVWEMTLCTHYDFPELERMQHTFSGRTTSGAGGLSSEGKQLGCTKQMTTPTL